MKVVSLTPGTGSFHCGSCLRDNALVLAMRKLGHDVLMVPLYLPFVHDGSDSSQGVPVFLGGVNAYLQQKSRFFRAIPKWMDRILDQPGFLRKISRNAGMTSASELGAIMVSTLKGEAGFQKKEILHLVDFLKKKEKPDVIMLSNVLLCGLIPTLKKELNCKIVVTLQGEDTFLDSLPAPWKKEAWSILRDLCKMVDLFIPVSTYHGDLMKARLNLHPEKIKAVHNGLDLSLFEQLPITANEPVLGMLSRLIPGKGLDMLTDAFIHIKSNKLIPNLKLRVAGSKIKADEPFVNSIIEKVALAGYENDVEFLFNITVEEKVNFLKNLTIFSTPAEYGESFGLYVIEALASGLPVIQPDSAAFPEILEKAGSGLLYKTGDYKSLAEKITECYGDFDNQKKIALSGAKKVKQAFSSDAMAIEVIQHFEAMLKA
jgi:glycosyltransferase involved in cell wall biosynthesis